MALSADELKRRITAAAALHGWRMNDLPDRLEEFGAQKHLATGLIDGRLTPRPAMISTLANFFGVPESWFTDEDWAALLRKDYVAPPEMADGIRRQKEGLEMMREGLTRLRSIETRLDLLEVPESEAEQPATKADLQSAAFELSADVAALHKEIEAVRRTQGRGAGGRASG